MRENRLASDVIQERKSRRPRAAAKRGESSSTVAGPPRRSARRGVTAGDIELTHPDRELWPGITKRDLTEYWAAIAQHALPGLVRRPLAIVRCPEGINGSHFFQKHGHGALPSAVRQGEAAGQPYLAIDNAAGLIAMAQISAIELHAWGATEARSLSPDQIVFDLDPGEGVNFDEVVQAAIDVRDQLVRLGLESFCRTTGGNGLHVVVPLEPIAEWDEIKLFCRTFAEVLGREEPE